MPLKQRGGQEETNFKSVMQSLEQEDRAELAEGQESEL